jgi:DNA polymerase III subunit delta
MTVEFEALPAALARDLAPAYLLYGEEPLFAMEAADLIRRRARAAGYTETEQHSVERNFDWNALRAASASLSLFGDKRLLEIRLPSGKPGEGAEVLADLATHALTDTCVLVISGKLDWRTLRDAPWVRAFDKHGIVVALSSVPAADLPRWLSTRAKAAGLDLDADAAAFLAQKTEGNLLAAVQELEKLRLAGVQGKLGLDVLAAASSDSARYDVFQLSAAAAAGDGPRAMRVLQTLKSEGVEPTLILWSLGREIRGMQHARERRRLRSQARLPWKDANPTPESRRDVDLDMVRLLVQTGAVDRIIKGQAVGDAWLSLTQLVANFAGVLPCRVQ